MDRNNTKPKGATYVNRRPKNKFYGIKGNLKNTNQLLKARKIEKQPIKDRTD